MGKEINNMVNDMTEVLNASQMQKLQEALVNAPRHLVIDFSKMVADVFKQISDGTRLRILWFLCHCEECVSNISAAMEINDLSSNSYFNTGYILYFLFC